MFVDSVQKLLSLWQMCDELDVDEHVQEELRRHAVDAEGLGDGGSARVADLVVVQDSMLRAQDSTLRAQDAPDAPRRSGR